MQQARGGIAHLRGQGLLTGKRVRQMPFRDGGRQCRGCPSRPLVRRAHHHSRLRPIGQLPLAVSRLDYGDHSSKETDLMSRRGD